MPGSLIRCLYCGATTAFVVAISSPVAVFPLIRKFRPPRDDFDRKRAEEFCAASRGTSLSSAFCSPFAPPLSPFYWVCGLISFALFRSFGFFALRFQHVPVPFGPNSDAAIPRPWIFRQKSHLLEVSFELIALRSLHRLPACSAFYFIYFASVQDTSSRSKFSIRFVEKELALSGNEHYTSLISCARRSAGH